MDMGRALSNMLRPLRTLESLDLCNVAIDAELLDEMAFHNQEGTQKFRNLPNAHGNQNILSCPDNLFSVCDRA